MPTDQNHGHVDIFVPFGCDVNTYIGEVISPISGLMVPETNSGHPDVYLIYPDTYYISGIVSALEFAGIEDPQFSHIDSIRFNLGHFSSSLDGANTDTGIHVEKGQIIGDIVSAAGHQKLAYKIYVIYDGVDIELSPTLFNSPTDQWPCVIDSPYDCAAESQDYIP